MSGENKANAELCEIKTETDGDEKKRITISIAYPDSTEMFDEGFFERVYLYTNLEPAIKDLIDLMSNEIPAVMETDRQKREKLLERLNNRRLKVSRRRVKTGKDLFTPAEISKRQDKKDWLDERAFFLTSFIAACNRLQLKSDNLTIENVSSEMYRRNGYSTQLKRNLVRFELKFSELKRMYMERSQGTRKDP